MTRLPELALILCTSCSTTPSTMDASMMDAGRTYRDGAAQNCVPIGTPNNEKGVGGYCETKDDCPMALCTGLFGAPPDAWFCSRLCMLGQDCGSGAMCVADPRGTACVPKACIVADAGTDAGMDASFDAPVDAADAAGD